MALFDATACVSILQQKSVQLNEQGIARYPQRSDFSEQEVVTIKSALGPWPRALEAAGLKPPRAEDHGVKVQEKRIRLKRMRNQKRKEKLL